MLAHYGIHGNDFTAVFLDQLTGFGRSCGADAFDRFESVINKKIKKLLLVEDDDTLREVLIDLVGNNDTETFEAKTGKEVEVLLREQRFDCMVLDLGLPDCNGIELLQRLTDNVELIVPPVIVYTGRDLSREEERELKKYSESIIIKDARSQERLLDETSLFLHRMVEKMPAQQQQIIADLYDRDKMFQGKKVLLVDDDMRNVFALSGVLEQKGMEVVIAEDGKKAIVMLDQEEDIDIVKVPGAFEIPLAAKKLARKQYDAIICLGAVIRGGTPHFDYVCAEVSKGIATVSMDAGIPVIFGVITTDSIEQAIERAGTKAGNKGWSAAISAVEMANLMDEMGGKIYVDTLAGDLSTDKIIEMVSNGEVKYTFADNNIASINASYYPNLDIRVPVSFSQRMAWAIRPNSDELLTELNGWIDSMKNGATYYVIYNKYFKNERSFRMRENSVYYSINHNRISEYDDLIQTYADTIGWDWRLVASMIYQESRFNPVSESWAGAKGLMQMMPQTAERYGVEDRTDPEDNLEGATKVLKVLWDRFIDIPDSVQRIKFTMAAYNCGYSHVIDARTLAEEDGIDSYRWDECVEESMLKLSYPENYNKPFIKYGYVRGIEPVSYVKQIFSRYEHYTQLLE